jgi:periplasmic protein TonB
MRRDFLFALIVSLLVHGGVAELGRHSPGSLQILLPELPVERMPMPPIEPDPLEIVKPEEKPAPATEVAPPRLADAPTLVPPNAPVQPMEPPQPESLTSTGVINIPTQQIGPGPNGSPEIFSPELLDQKPTPTYQAKPIYPFEMRRSEISGQVVVGFVVDDKGNVTQAVAISSSQREFEVAAVQSVSHWKFKPGRKAGRPVYTRMQVPILFTIAARENSQ